MGNSAFLNAMVVRMYLSAYSVAYGVDRIVEGKFSRETTKTVSSSSSSFGTMTSGVGHVEARERDLELRLLAGDLQDGVGHRRNS